MDCEEGLDGNFLFHTTSSSYRLALFHFITADTMKIESSQKLIFLEKEANKLKRIRDIRKILLSSGAYSEKNIEMQNMKFDNANVPEWERDIIQKSWKATKLLAHSLFSELDLLSDSILTEYEKDGKEIQ